MKGKKKQIVDVQPTVDLRPAANAFQGLTGVAFFFLGGGMGAFMAGGGRRLLGAMMGAVAGFVLGVFLSGCVLVFTPPPPQMIDLVQWQTKYRRLHRRRRYTALFLFVWTTVAFIWLLVRQPFLDEWFALALVPAIICILLLQYTAQIFDLHRCPRCDELFGRPSVFHDYPHHCKSCRFQLHADDLVEVEQVPAEVSVGGNDERRVDE